MAAVVLDVKKVSGGSPRGLMCHSLRQRDSASGVILHVPDNADPARTGDNQVLVGPEILGPAMDAAAAAVPDRQPDGRKVRKDAVRYAALDLGVSAEWFGGRDGAWEPAAVEEFQDAVMEWLRKHCPGKVVSAVMHCDETTPHVHVLLVPLAADGRCAYKRCFGDRRRPEVLRDLRRTWHEAVARARGCVSLAPPRRGGHGERDITEYKKQQDAVRMAEARIRAESAPRPESEATERRVTPAEEAGHTGLPPDPGRSQAAEEFVRRLPAALSAEIDKLGADEGLGGFPEPVPVPEPPQKKHVKPAARSPVPHLPAPVTPPPMPPWWRRVWRRIATIWEGEEDPVPVPEPVNWEQRARENDAKHRDAFQWAAGERHDEQIQAADEIYAAQQEVVAGGRALNRAGEWARRLGGLIALVRAKAAEIAPQPEIRQDPDPQQAPEAQKRRVAPSAEVGGGVALPPIPPGPEEEEGPAIGG